jgi:hypothetical protein
MHPLASAAAVNARSEVAITANAIVLVMLFSRGPLRWSENTSADQKFHAAEMKRDLCQPAYPTGFPTEPHMTRWQLTASDERRCGQIGDNSTRGGPDGTERDDSQRFRKRLLYPAGLRRKSIAIAFVLAPVRALSVHVISLGVEN